MFLLIYSKDVICLAFLLIIACFIVLMLIVSIVGFVVV